MPYSTKEKRQAYDKKRYIGRKALGKCPACGEKRCTVSIFCEVCRGKRHKRNEINNPVFTARYRAEGLCTGCGGERDDKTLVKCMNCRMHANEGRPYR